MYSILRADADGPTVRYTYTRDGLEDAVWNHTTVIDPLSDWVEGSLIPLAKRKGTKLKLREVVKHVSELAAKSHIRYSDIDWLGLTLITAGRYRDCLGKLAATQNAVTQKSIPAMERLQSILFEMYDEISRAVAEVLKKKSSRNAA